MKQFFAALGIAVLLIAGCGGDKATAPATTNDDNSDLVGSWALVSINGAAMSAPHPTYAGYNVSWGVITFVDNHLFQRGYMIGATSGPIDTATTITTGVWQRTAASVTLTLFPTVPIVASIAHDTLSVTDFSVIWRYIRCTTTCHTYDE